MPKEMLYPIIMADDDRDDCEMTRQAFLDSKVANPFITVPDGEKLLEYLQRKDVPRPSLILLDLNMPKMDGREVLGLIKKDERFRRIPVVILTTSKADEDILNSYDMGANSYITKPVTFEGLVAVIKSLKDYWLGIVQLPPEGDA
jgi:two-component system, response regulator